MKSLLIIGGTGTLSQTVAIVAEKRGFHVTVLNRGSRNDILPKSISVIVSDFYDKDQMEISLVNCRFDVVVDFLSRTPDDIKRVSPLFSKICKQYVFVSSACVFCREKKDLPITELSRKPNRQWSYNVEKYESEEVFKEILKDKDCYYTIIRPYITYDEKRIPIAIAPDYKFHKTIIDRIKAGKPMFVIADGSALSTVTYVEDFAIATVALLDNPKAINEDFNVVGDFAYSHKYILEQLYEKLGVNPNIVCVDVNLLLNLLPNYAEMILGDRSLEAQFDNKKLKNAIDGLNFTFDLNVGLQKVLDYYNQQKDYLVDYKYDAQIDRLINKSSQIALSYVKYGMSNGRLTYFLFSRLNYKLAQKIYNVLKKVKLVK